MLLMQHILIVKNLVKSRAINKISKNKAYEVAISSKYDGYQRGLASMVFFHEICSG